MNDIYVFLIVLLAMVLSALVIYLVFRRRENKLIDSLQGMLDSANNGEFHIGSIDERKLSSLESNFKKYLSDSELVRGNQSSQKDKIQALISDISHQTITPISNIMLYSQLIEEQQNEFEEEISAIREQTEKLDFLIASLVKVSRMETGIITVSPIENKISSITESLNSQFSSIAQKSNISLKIMDTDITAKFDLKWTTEAIANIVDNALKYTPNGGEVTVSAERYNLFARIDIQDNGIGIAENEQNKIFTRFFRAAAVNDKPGVGIGLYLSREIIRNQKGYVKVKSEVGNGALFSVFIPVV